MEFFGISGSELLLILVVGVIIAGPRHAAQGIMWLRQALQYLRRWSAKLREETTAAGSGLKVDLSGFDPSQFNPRHLVKEAVAEEMQLWIKAITTCSSPEVTQLEPGETPDFTTDSEKPVPESLKLFEPQLRALQALHQQAPHEPDENKLSEGNNSPHPTNPTTTKPDPVNPIDNNAEVGNPTGSSAQTALPEEQEPIVTPPQNQLS